MTSFRQREGSFLLKTPDLCIPDLHAPRSFTIVDIKVVDPAAPSYIDMTSKSAIHRHRALETAVSRDYFGPSRRPPSGARMRVKVVTFLVSTYLVKYLGPKLRL